ncbi:hypothetical protein C1H46_002241 [Malus baccata]|uniref:Uncharacterized protein n=1 Tax=Malus baccata TaxID=106549 RepID=A0A540NMA8_MALBA|nr:hypothetical protein C1H46_002241 [Malus baccata]
MPHKKIVADQPHCATRVLIQTRGRVREHYQNIIKAMQTMRKPVKYWKTNSLEIKISEMASNQKQQSRKPAEGEAKGKVEEGLPMKDSPYLQYDNLEDYKRQAYGTEGHQQVEPGRGAGSTEAPTVSGTTVSSQGDISAPEAINQQGVP